MVQSLHTLVHISDLHIGEIDPASGNAALSKPALKILQNFNWLDGLLGHQARSLQDLAAFLKNVAGTDPKAKLVVTGDLSRLGSLEELNTAREYFTASIDLMPPNGLTSGLNLGASLPLVIAGNHDHWGGSPFPLTYKASNFQRSSFPYVAPPLPLGPTHKLVLCGIDSDADVTRVSLDRLLARGAFQSQLSKLAPKLAAPNQNEIRVLLVHHSYLHRGFTLETNAASRAALTAFVQTHGISTVLTGHTHEERVGLVATDADGRTCYEYCCGTTTQLDAVPFGWRSFAGNLPRRNWPSNTLMVHTIQQHGASLVWDAQTYFRTPSHGFQVLNGMHYQQPI